MNKPAKQHLIDPEICIRCYTCEMTCPIDAIEHDGKNVVVNYDKCDFCMACIPVCPTGSIDEWRVVKEPYSLEEQYSWEELPEQAEFSQEDSQVDPAIEAIDENVATLLAQAHAGTGGRAKAPLSASKPTVNMYTIATPVEAVVQGNYRITSEDSGVDVRHIILDFGRKLFPVIEGQSVGIIPPGVDEAGKPFLPRLYSVSSPRDGERQNFNNVSLTVKREEGGVCSNYICDLKKDDVVNIVGPFGSTFLYPNDAKANLLMICTGTGSAPFRAFTMRRQRRMDSEKGKMLLFFGARSPDSLPYFGPLNKIPESVLSKHLVFSRMPDVPKEYVQDRLLSEREKVASILGSDSTHIYVCGIRGMEDEVDKALSTIAEGIGLSWSNVRDEMRQQGRYHVETY